MKLKHHVHTNAYNTILYLDKCSCRAWSSILFNACLFLLHHRYHFTIIQGTEDNFFLRELMGFHFLYVPIDSKVLLWMVLYFLSHQLQIYKSWYYFQMHYMLRDNIAFFCGEMLHYQCYYILKPKATIAERVPFYKVFVLLILALLMPVLLLWWWWCKRKDINNYSVDPKQEHVLFALYYLRCTDSDCVPYTNY